MPSPWMTPNEIREREGMPLPTRRRHWRRHWRFYVTSVVLLAATLGVEYAMGWWQP